MHGSLREQLQPIRERLGPLRPWCDGKQRHVSMGAAEAHARSLRRCYGAHVAAYLLSVVPPVSRGPAAGGAVNLMNLIEGIQQECNRVREILPHYDELGPVGVFGATMLRQCIREGEQAIASGDVVRMMKALTELRDCK